MADLSGLLRVKNYALEQKQKFLSELYRQAEELENQKQTLLAQLAEEEEKVKAFDAEMMSYFGPYSEAVKQRVSAIDVAAQTLEVQIDAAREDMRAAFAEMKKIEMTQEAREEREQKALDKKEADELDEIGIETFRRGQEE